ASKEEREAREKGLTKVDDVATAQGLIDYARRADNEKPIALLTAAELLLTTGPADKVKMDVEGGKVVEVKFYGSLRDLVKEAGKMPGGTEGTAKALADD